VLPSRDLFTADSLPLKTYHSEPTVNNLKVVRAKFSTLSWVVFVTSVIALYVQVSKNVLDQNLKNVNVLI
jgi:hypothetical protein